MGRVSVPNPGDKQIKYGTVLFCFNLGTITVIFYSGEYFAISKIISFDRL